VTRPKALSSEAIAAALAASPGWAREGDALVKTFEFPRYGAGLAFAVAVGIEAEKADHHPDLTILWRKVRVLWTTHDAGGITELDVELARRTDEAAGHS
jgi:4a-hydroxytetrahydrobiopterin dehydratase